MLTAFPASGAPKNVEPRIRVFERACLATRADQNKIVALAAAERWSLLGSDVAAGLTPLVGVRVKGWALPGSPLQAAMLLSVRSATPAGPRTCAIQFFGGGAAAFDSALKTSPSSVLVDMKDAPDRWIRSYRVEGAKGSMGVTLTAGREFLGPFTATAHSIKQ